MKAQSELMGDHERTAEMTVPRRLGGVTTWVPGILNDRLSAMTKSLSSIRTDLDSPLHTALSNITKPFADSKPSAICKNEVNYRPAVRQRTVCTP